ncbi:hypothetical protein GCM10009555_069740 [Acrocarpospora macrocephala]|uniref:Uncharacterized protein n=1 Tax=Acrocarpospora macrocephala TaxID=150177 RepID=A0A5M3X2R9_9ACTN|nr:hypothetical protein [Acrocarpospora macrocephala]GES13113.1 hypothetical protein Amac_067100 [Acrocarpospora macrocephala]
MGTHELGDCLRVVNEEITARLGEDVDRGWRLKLQTAQEVLEDLMKNG